MLEGGAAFEQGLSLGHQAFEFDRADFRAVLFLLALPLPVFVAFELTLSAGGLFVEKIGQVPEEVVEVGPSSGVSNNRSSKRGWVGLGQQFNYPTSHALVGSFVRAICFCHIFLGLGSLGFRCACGRRRPCICGHPSQCTGIVSCGLSHDHRLICGCRFIRQRLAGVLGLFLCQRPLFARNGFAAQASLIKSRNSVYNSQALGGGEPSGSIWHS